MRDDVVVLAGGSGVDAAEIDRIGREAIAVVAAEWRLPWRRRVLVLAPADRSQLEAVTGITAERPAVSAAMAIETPGLGSYVVLDPTAWAQATAPGRRALLIHETVHLAVGSGDGAPPTAGTGIGSRSGSGSGSGSSEPAWLCEGFAQEVAYRAIGAEPAAIAPDLLARIARDGPPGRLPTAADFEGTGASRDDAYALAWIAVRTLRRLGGDDAPRRSQEARTPHLPGITSPAFVRAWQADLRGAARTAARTAAR